jgi:bacteriocin-like protein
MKAIKEKDPQNFSLLSNFKELEIKNLKSINGGADGNIDKPTGTGKPPK